MKKEIENIMSIIDNIEKKNKKISKYVTSLVEKNEDLILRNTQLQDEVDSLWAMMDEITKSDIENFSHILEEIKADVITKALMVTKKKALA